MKEQKAVQEAQGVKKVQKNITDYWNGIKGKISNLVMEIIGKIGI